MKLHELNKVNKDTKKTDQNELLSAIMERNQKHFNQAASTPFAQEPLASLTPPLKSNHQLANKLFKGNTTDFSSFDRIILAKDLRKAIVLLIFLKSPKKL